MKKPRKNDVVLTFTEDDYRASKVVLERLGFTENFIRSINNFSHDKDENRTKQITCIVAQHEKQLEAILNNKIGFSTFNISSILKVSGPGVGRQIEVLLENLPRLQELRDKGISAGKIAGRLKSSGNYLQNRIDKLLEDPYKDKDSKKIDELEPDDGSAPLLQKKKRGRPPKAKDSRCVELEMEYELHYKENKGALEKLGFKQGFIDAVGNGPATLSLQKHYINKAAQQIDNLRIILDSSIKLNPQNISEIIRGSEDNVDRAIEVLANNLHALLPLVNNIGLNGDHLALMLGGSGVKVGEVIGILNEKINILAALKSKGALLHRIAFALKGLKGDVRKIIDDFGRMHGINFNEAPRYERSTSVLDYSDDDVDFFVDEHDSEIQKFMEDFPEDSNEKKKDDDKAKSPEWYLEGLDYSFLDGIDIDLPANNAGTENLDPDDILRNLDEAIARKEALEQSAVATAPLALLNQAPAANNIVEPDNYDFDAADAAEVPVEPEEEDAAEVPVEPEEEIDRNLSLDEIENKVLEKFGYALVIKKGYGKSIIIKKIDDDAAENIEINFHYYKLIKNIANFYKKDEVNDVAIQGFRRLCAFIKNNRNESPDALKNVMFFFHAYYKKNPPYEDAITSFLIEFSLDKNIDEILLDLAKDPKNCNDKGRLSDIFRKLFTQLADYKKIEQEILQEIGFELVDKARLKKIGDSDENCFNCASYIFIKDLAKARIAEDVDKIALAKLIDFIKNNASKNPDFLNKICDFYNYYYRFGCRDKNIAARLFIAEFAGESSVDEVLLNLVAKYNSKHKFSGFDSLFKPVVTLKKSREDVLQDFGFELLEKTEDKAKGAKMFFVKRCNKAGKKNPQTEVYPIFINDIIRYLSNESSVKSQLGLAQLSSFIKYNNQYPDLLKRVSYFYNQYYKPQVLFGKTRIELFLEEFSGREDIENILLKIAENENYKNHLGGLYGGFSSFFNKEISLEEDSEEIVVDVDNSDDDSDLIDEPEPLLIYNYVGDNTPLSHENSLVLARFVYTSPDFGVVFSGEEYDRRDLVKYIAYSSDDSLDDFLYNAIKDFIDSEEIFLPMKLCNGRLERVNGLDQIIGNTHVTGLFLQKNDDGTISIEHMNSSGDYVPNVVERVGDRIRGEGFNLRYCEIMRNCSKQKDGYSCAYHAEYNLLQRYRVALGMAPLYMTADDFILQAKKYLQQYFNHQVLPGFDESRDKRFLINQVNECLGSEDSSIAKLMNLIAIKDELVRQKIPQQSINAFFISALQKCLVEEYVALDPGNIANELQKIMKANSFLHELYERITFMGTNVVPEAAKIGIVGAFALEDEGMALG